MLPAQFNYHVSGPELVERVILWHRDFRTFRLDRRTKVGLVEHSLKVSIFGLKFAKSKVLIVGNVEVEL